jgi:hypothetical protein
VWRLGPEREAVQAASVVLEPPAHCRARSLFACLDISFSFCPPIIPINYHSLSAQSVPGVCGGSAADTTPGLRSGRHWGASCGTVHHFRPSRPGCCLTQPLGKLRMSGVYTQSYPMV